MVNPISPTGRVPRLAHAHHLPHDTSEDARAVRKALQDRMAEHATTTIDLTTTEDRIHAFFTPDRHPATTIGE